MERLSISWCILCILTRCFFIYCNEDFEKIHFTDSWAVHIENGSEEIASDIADKHKFISFGQIGSLPGYFHFVRKKSEGRRKRRETDNTVTLLSEEKIKWVEQQHVLEREKRSVVPDYISTVHSTAYSIQDPLYNDQWYLNNVGQSSGPPGMDINVLPVWSRGISGKGVVVAILDDGLDHTHPDLKKNYDARASYDFNDYDEDPMPKASDPSNCHGTKCAGEVAAEAGNNVCGVGVAFNCSIGGIRMLDGNVTDTIEGSALSFKKDFIDIYSCAWGPKDDGKRFGRPGTLASKALELGVKEGRAGRGSIFIWATGNGGLTDDDCNCDGYTTSVYTISVGAISDHGLSTYYTESCASTLAVTYSGGSHREKKENKIVTTTLNHKCTDEFKGTSSAAPMAAGMMALMLEANYNLTWRDVQHIIVETSLMTSPLDEGWRRNGAGKWFNQKFGFGRMDASAMVEKAQGWNNVADSRICWSDKSEGPWDIPSAGTVLVAMNSSVCDGTSSEIKTLEHVQVVLSMKHRHRGHVSIELISPSGTRTQLLKTRRNDKSNKGLKDWIFMSVHFWGEDPKGIWTLAVTDNSNNNREHHRDKSKYGDLEDANEALQDEMDGKDNTGTEHESVVDDNDLFTSSEEFENDVFKDGSYRKTKNDKTQETKEETKVNEKTKSHRDEKKSSKKGKKVKVRDKNDKLSGVKQKLVSKQKHSKTIKQKSKEEIAADKLVENLLGDEISGSKPDDSQNNDTSNGDSKVDTFINSHSNNSKLQEQSSKETSKTKDSDESSVLENILKNVLSAVFSNIRTSGSKNDMKSFEERLAHLEATLIKNESKVVNESISSILLKALKDGNAVDKIDNVLAALSNSANQTKFANTSYTKNVGVVSDVLKLLRDILTTKKDDPNTKGYKQKIYQLLEASSNGSNKLREKLFSDLDVTSGGKEISPTVINDALTLISHILKHKGRKSRKLSSLSKDIRILLRSQNGKFLLPVDRLVDRGNGQQEITTTKTTSSKEIHHQGNDVETVTIEHVNVDEKPSKSEQTDTSKVNQGKLSISKIPEFELKSSHRTFYGPGSNPSYDNEHTNFNSERRDNDNSPKMNDDTGFTIAIMKNGKTIDERRVDKEQARDYLFNKGNYIDSVHNDKDSNFVKPSSSDKNIDIELTFAREKQKMEEVDKTKQDLDQRFDEQNKFDNNNIDFSVIRPFNGKKIDDRDDSTGHSSDEKYLNFRSHFDDSEISPSSHLSRKSEHKKKKTKAHKKSHTKKHNHGEVEDSFTFPFLAFTDPSQLPPPLVVPRSDDTERFVQQLYNPFNPNRFNEYENFPTMEEQASFYDNNDQKIERKSELFDTDKRSDIPVPTLSNDQKGFNILTNRDINIPIRRSNRRRRSIVDGQHSIEFPGIARQSLGNNDVTNAELKRAKRENIEDDDADSTDDEDGPHVVKRSAIFSELHPSKQPSVTEDRNENVKTTTSQYINKNSYKDIFVDKRSAVKKALTLEGTLKQKLLSMRKESSSVLNIMKRVHDDIAIGDSTDLRNLEKELSTLDTSSSSKINNSLNENSKDRNSLVRTKVSKSPGKYDIKDPDEYYKYGVSASGELIEWTIKFFGTGP